MTVPVTILFLILATFSAGAGERWWKGNLHTHTFWSDGDDFPDMATRWYKANGYHFLAISDHNILLEGEKWISMGTNATRALALEKYRATYPEYVMARTNVTEKGTNIQVRLATLGELKKRFEARNRFLLIPSEEISAEADKKPIHINATNLRDYIKPRNGTNVLEVMQMNIDAVLAQRQRTGQPMFPHLNHPNFHFAVSAEDLMRVEGEKFFEVYNGHPAVFNEGDEKHPSTERMWDMVLAWRLGVLNLGVMFGVAVDDTHNYHHAGFKNANAGRGWVMVRAKRLTAEHIVHAMEAGDFYASTGVRLKKMKRGKREISLEVDAEPGVSYTILFIGTKRSFVKTVKGKPEVDGAKIGELLAPEVKGTKAKYRLGKDDLYARAVVVSSKVKRNGQPEEVEKAWVQPVFGE